MSAPNATRCEVQCPHGEHTCILSPHQGGNHYCRRCECVYDLLGLHMHDGRDVEQLERERRIADEWTRLLAELRQLIGARP